MGQTYTSIEPIRDYISLAYYSTGRSEYLVRKSVPRHLLYLHGKSKSMHVRRKTWEEAEATLNEMLAYIARLQARHDAKEVSEEKIEYSDVGEDNLNRLFAKWSHGSAVPRGNFNFRWQR